MKKRAVILFGAGASVEYGVDSTTGLTDAIEHEVLLDGWLRETGGDKAYSAIQDGLNSYLQNKAHFEQIYHCSTELLNHLPPTAGAMDEFRPLLYPFLSNKLLFDDRALRSLAQKIADVIFSRVSKACEKNALSLSPLTQFIATMRKEYTTRIYTTNYDDFPLQAVPDLYTGFEPTSRSGPKFFDPDDFWAKPDIDSIFHLHGSVHLGFQRPTPPNGDIGDLYWFDDRAEAIRSASFRGSDRRRMDGGSYLRTAIITGLDKLSRIQQRPMSHFYTSMSRDMMLADVIFVIGSGLGDLHLNTWLRESRERTSPAPILLVDYWPSGFSTPTSGAISPKETEMIHSLRIRAGMHFRNSTKRFGWHIAEDLNSAVWDFGFQKFLDSQDEFKIVLDLLTRPIR